MQVLTQQEAAETPLSKQEVERIANGLTGPPFCDLDLAFPILTEKQTDVGDIPHGRSTRK